MSGGLGRLVQAQLAVADRQDPHHCAVCGRHLDMWYLGFPYPLCPACLDHRKRGPWFACPLPARRHCDRPECLGSPGPLSPLMITIADGESRAARTWPDGSWSCPFCSGANLPASEYYQGRHWWPGPCANPACIAGGRGSAAEVAEYRRARALAAERTARLARDAEAARESIDWASREREMRCAEASQASRAEGWCYECWAKSTGYGRWMSRPKKIRHREPENCPRRRK